MLSLTGTLPRLLERMASLGSVVDPLWVDVVGTTVDVARFTPWRQYNHARLDKVLWDAEKLRVRHTHMHTRSNIPLNAGLGCTGSGRGSCVVRMSYP